MAASYPKILKLGTQAAYNAIESKDSSVLYFTSDTHKIYKGGEDYTAYAKVVDTLPSTTATLATGTIYLAQDTGKVSFYDGSAWHVVSYPAVTAMVDAQGAEISDVIDDNHIATTEAIKEYVASIIGSSANVVSSVVSKTGAAGTIVVTKADGTHSDVTVHDVFTSIADTTHEEGGSEVVTAGSFTLTDTDGDTTDYLVKKVMTGIAADDTDAATLNVALTSGTHADVVVPKVMTGIAAGTTAGVVTVSMSSGSHADVTVPKVFKSVAWDSTARTLTFTDTDGVNTGADHVVNLGKDIFIDQNADNRYENGNLYLYLNDGTQSSNPTEIVIPVTGLITDYVGGKTNTVELSVDNTTHIVTADAKIRANGTGFTNALKVSSSTSAVGGVGMYVDLSDVEESIDALATAITWGTF